MDKIYWMMLVYSRYWGPGGDSGDVKRKFDILSEISEILKYDLSHTNQLTDITAGLEVGGTVGSEELSRIWTFYFCVVVSDTLIRTYHQLGVQGIKIQIGKLCFEYIKQCESSQIIILDE